MRTKIWTHKNTLGAQVFDVDGAKTIFHVEKIVDDGAEVRVTTYLQPLRLNADGDEAETEVRRFRSIYPIGMTKLGPALFHLYGPLHQGTA